MLRTWIVPIGLLAATFSSGGCRSCSTCHDYDPPVANCDCGACGTHRAGSASGGYASGEYVDSEQGNDTAEEPANQPPAQEETEQR